MKKKTAKKKATKKKSPARKAAKRKAVARKAAPRRAVAKRAVARKAAKKAAASRKAAPARKAAPRKKAAAANGAAKKAAPPPVPRRDATGHLNPAYEAQLRELTRESAEPKDPASFLTGTRSGDPLAEEMGQEFVETAVSGEDSSQGVLGDEVDEERGGPFVKTTAQQEFGHGVDPSNPKGSKREPFPTT